MAKKTSDKDYFSSPEFKKRAREQSKNQDSVIITAGQWKRNQAKYGKKSPKKGE